MNRTAITVLCLSLIVFGLACQPHPEEAPRDEIRRALPTSETMRVNLPQENAQQFALGEIADTYKWTRAITREFNAGAAWVLIVVHTVVQFPPTEVNGDTYVWGPHSDALDPAEWRLTVVDNGDGSYAWNLEGRSKSTPEDGFLSLINGVAVPGQNPHRGSGNFSIDFDNIRTVDPVDNPDARGTVDVDYDLENTDGTQATLAMHIESTDEAGEAVSADYHYGESQDGAGDFVFSFSADLDENGSAAEDARIRSRWQADGAGRSDVTATGGDLGSGELIFSQCWDTQFRSVYEDLFQASGDPDACVFEDQDLPGA